MSYLRFNLYKKQISRDDGDTWKDLEPEEYVPSGSPIGEYDTYEDCMSFEPKYILTQNDSTIISAECDSTNAITQNEVSAYSANVVSVVIGDCVENIGIAAFQWFPSLTSVTIPISVSEISSFAFNGCSSLSSITIHDSVISVGDSVFDACTNLRNVKLPNGLTYINPFLFARCSSLKSVAIPESVKRIGEYAFHLSGISNIVIPKNVYRIEEAAFDTATGLTSIDIPDSVAIIDEKAFQNCSGLTHVTIGSGVTEIWHDAFTNCSGLTSITINATTPPRIWYWPAFDNTNNCPIYVPCESLNAYRTASGWSDYSDRIRCSELYRTVTSGTTCIGADKYNLDVCEASYDGGLSWQPIASSAGTLIEENSYDCGYRTRETSGTPYCSGYNKMIDIYTQVSYDGGTNWQTTTTVTDMLEENSYDCGYIPPATKFSLTLNNSNVVTAICDSNHTVTSGEVATQYSGTVVSAIIGGCADTIGNGAFFNCRSLSSVSISNTVTKINYSAFVGCFSLGNVSIPNSVTVLGQEAFFACTALTSVVLSENTSKIYEGCFFGDWSLTSVTIPSSITYIGAQSFENCSGLTKITINATTPPELGSNAFDNTGNCPIYVPCESVNAYKSASIWSNYSSRITCRQTKYSLTLNDSTIVDANCDSTSAITSGEVATQYSGTVVSAQIGNCVKTIGNGAFKYCSYLTGITIPDNVTTIGEEAFYYCYPSLTSVKIGNGVTTIGKDAFVVCRNLSALTIGNSVVTIGEGAFRNCEALTSITIPDSVTTIGDDAFNTCIYATSLTIGSGVTSIGKGAFSHTVGLQSITIYATTPPTLAYEYEFYDSNCPIYVPSGSVNAYKTATNWSEYASRIQAIP